MASKTAIELNRILERGREAIEAYGHKHGAALMRSEITGLIRELGGKTAGGTCTIGEAVAARVDELNALWLADKAGAQ